jgi:sortase (surface protein transpeptidase)
VALLLVGLFAAAVGFGQLGELRLPTLDDLFGPFARSSGPTDIAIPAINVSARVVDVGTAADGSIDVPTSDPVHTAGWYDRGPDPGDVGTAVIVGHVDTRTQPAVFYGLRQLSPGARIEVTRRDHRVASFRVDSIDFYPKTEFPGASVFRASAQPRLVLVTCGGPWVGGETGYADNVVVFASLAA